MTELATSTDSPFSEPTDTTSEFRTIPNTNAHAHARLRFGIEMELL